MRHNIKYISFLACVMIAFVLVELYRPKPIDWSPTLSSKDKIPYGTFLLFDVLNDVFPAQKINASRLPVFNYLEAHPEFKGNYIFIEPRFEADSLSLSRLLSFVERGNDLFIASESIDDKLLDTLKIKEETAMFKSISPKVNFVFNQDKKQGQDFSILREFSFFVPKKAKTTPFTVLAQTTENQSVFIKAQWGKGTIYLHSQPAAFTNQALIKNKDHAFTALSYLPLKPVIWDEFLKQGRVGENSLLRVIMNYESLQWAYYIILFGLIVYVVFEGKRRQRIIPVQEPLKNASLEFVKVIGALHHNKKDFKHIAEKRINYLMEYIRSKYYMRTNEIDDSFVVRLQAKTGLPADGISELFGKIGLIKQQANINADVLMDLNKHIEEFYRSTKK